MLYFIVKSLLKEIDHVDLKTSLYTTVQWLFCLMLFNVVKLKNYRKSLTDIFTFISEIRHLIKRRENGIVYCQIYFSRIIEFLRAINKIGLIVSKVSSNFSVVQYAVSSYFVE